MNELARDYRRDGFLAAVDVVDEDMAGEHRRRMEAAEAELGPLHYRDKIHTVMCAAAELITHPRLLDAVEDCIGPDILIYNSMYIVKEPGAGSYVAWHQDLTYWGLADDDAQVSAWLALSPATAESGCMRMIPGSHLDGRREHRTSADRDPDAVLFLGQRIEDVDEAGACHVPLAPGQASLHHGWTMHTSAPNRSADRRIGLNVQYVAPHNRQLEHDGATAWLVRGDDPHGHFVAELPSSVEIDRDAVGAQAAHQERITTTYQNLGSRNP